jgi:hypothetical protein
MVVAIKELDVFYKLHFLAMLVKGLVGFFILI